MEFGSSAAFLLLSPRKAAETLNPTTQGSPDAPRCGFSAQVVQALRATGADFQHFDILQDNAIREGLKARPEMLRPFCSQVNCLYMYTSVQV